MKGRARSLAETFTAKFALGLAVTLRLALGLAGTLSLAERFATKLPFAEVRFVHSVQVMNLHRILISVESLATGKAFSSLASVAARVLRT